MGGSRREQLGYFFLAPFLLCTVSWALVVPPVDTSYDPSLPPLQHWGGGQLPTPTSLWVPFLLILPTLLTSPKADLLTNHLFIGSIWG